VRSFRAELLKLIHRPATLWITAIALVSMVLVVYMILYFASQGGDNVPPEQAAELRERLYPARFHDAVLSNTNQLFHILAVVLGALSLGSEYGWGTWKTIFTQRPGRLPVMAGKLAGLSSVVIGLTLILFLAAAGSSYVAASVDGLPKAWPSGLGVVRAIGAGTLVMLFWALFGAALATVLRQSAIAIGLATAYIFAELLSRSVLISTSLFRFLPGVNATALLNSAGTIQGRAPANQIEGTQAAMVLVAYVVAFAILALALVHRRDVK
jgi:ABC-2 type transport system permease protein